MTTTTPPKSRTDAGWWLALVVLVFVALAPTQIVAALVFAAARLLCLFGATLVLVVLFREQRP